MNKKVLAFIGVFVIVIIAVSTVWLVQQRTAGPIPVACSREAKICPNGSTVGRVGPNCEFATCPFDTVTPPPPEPVAVRGQLHLAVGQTGKSDGLSVTFNSVVSDSRCPSGVQCVWAGEVTASLYLSIDGKSETKNISSAQKPYEFAGYTIAIDSVEPGTKAGKEIAGGEYRITFKIVKPDVPVSVSETGVIGKVTLGPICPVAPEGDAACAGKPYSTTIQVIVVGSVSSAPYATLRSLRLGDFKTLLPPGQYALQPVGGNPFPRCETKEVTVVAGELSKVDLSCDTGIR